MYLFEREARRFLDKSARPPSCESPLKIPGYLVQSLAARILIAITTAHTALSADFYLQGTAVGNSAVYKFAICFLWRSELLIPRMLLFSAGKSATKAPRY